MKHLLLAWTTALYTALAADLPPLTIPQGVGVNIHFNRGHTADLDRIAAAGFKFVRMDLGWAGIERRRGEYDWSAYEELISNLERRGLRAILILDYSNPLYEEAVTARNPVFGGEQRDTASPQHPESVAAFARWAAAAATHFQGRRVIWEIWNEPNISFWKPKPDVTQYTTLALATCKAIRAVDPKATIIGPATSEVPLPFLETFFAGGALEYLDAVSIHPYRNYAKPPETAAEDYAKLRALIAQYAPSKKKNLPIISGEWGYASHTRGVSLETQAAFAARQQLANLLAGVPLSIWYDWKNDGTDPAEREHNFGVVTDQLAAKPAYLAIKTLTTELAGYRIKQRVSVASDRDYVLLFVKRRAAPKLAVWTLDDPHSVSVPVKARARASVKTPDAGGVVVESQGASLTTSSNAGAGPKIALSSDQLRFEVGPLPLYLTLEGVRISE